MIGAGSGLTVREEGRSGGGVGRAAVRLVATRASILLDSPRRLGASKMSKIWGRSIGVCSSAGSVIAEALDMRRHPADATDALRASKCCEEAKTCRTEEVEAAMADRVK